MRNSFPFKAAMSVFVMTASTLWSMQPYTITPDRQNINNFQHTIGMILSAPVIGSYSAGPANFELSNFTRQIEDTIETDAIQQYLFFGQSAQDEFGTAVSSAGDVNADGYDDIIIGAPLNDAGGTDAGRAYIYFGGPVVNLEADVVLTGLSAYQYFGLSVSSAGDVNNDGYDDVIAGAPCDGFNNYSSKAYIYFGGPSMNNIPDVILSGSYGFGFSVSGLGDINDDGYSDVAVGFGNSYYVYFYFGGNPMNNVADMTLINFTIGGFGVSVSPAGDINGDGYSDFAVGSWLNSTGGFTHNGSVYVYYGGTLLDNIADVTIHGTSYNERLGNDVSCAGDVNGDGFSDLFAGALTFDNNRGKACIYYGGASMNTVADVTVTGEVYGDYLGQSVTGVGDINGDGFDDVIAGAYRNSSSAGNAGKAYLFYGGVNMNNIADNLFDGMTANSGLGSSLSSAGDFNNDGYPDFLIGAYQNSDAGLYAGKVYLYTNTADLTQISMINFPGYQAFARYGYSSANAGDVNADGFDDVVIGVSNDVSGQPAKVYFGSRLFDNVSDVSLYGSPYVSLRVASAGDVNNDGYDDIITADPFNITNGTDAGAAFIFLGGQNMSGVPYITLYGAAPGDNFGYSLSTAGDVNNDGFDDVIVGAPFNDGNGVNAGAAYVFYGASAMNNIPDVIMYGESSGDQFGFSVSGGGQVNIDQFDDVAVGSPYNSSVYQEAGRVYLFNGGNPMNGNADLVINSPPSVTAQSRFGYSLESSGDVNGDDFCDILVGSLLHTNLEGMAFIYFGGSTIDNIADVTISGENFPYQFAGSLSMPGDLNSDGFDDIIIGEASHNFYSEYFRGRISVYYGGLFMDNNADRIIYGENHNDYFGYSVSGAGDVDGDGVNEFMAGAPSNDQYGTEAGQVYLYKGSETAQDINDLELTGIPSEQFGYTVSSAGDFNTDGFTDLVVGAPKASSGGTESGKAQIYFGGSRWDKNPDIMINGAAAFDHFGTSVSSAGDVNQDGYNDIIIGAPENDAGGTDAGRAYIFFGGPTPDGIADLILTGESAGIRFGFSVSKAGNVNGDFAADVIVGAPFSNAGGNQSGRTYLYYGSASMDNVPDVVMTPSGAGLWFGISCSFAGDVNGDTYDDVIVGASMAAGVGNGYAIIYYGSPGMNNVEDVIMTGSFLDDHLGYSVSYAGDVNGDSFADVIVGAYGYDIFLRGTDAGAAYIFYGGSNMNNTSDVYIEGASENDYFGISVSNAGRINSDGYDDVIIGACYNDAGGVNAGRAYVYYGGINMNNKRDLLMTGNIPNGNFGWAVASAGDLNVDGRGDVIAGGFNNGRANIYMSSEPVEQLILTLKIAEEGFYDAGNQRLNMSDTVSVSLRYSYFPFSQVDVAKAVISKVTMEGRFFFNTAPAGNYYLKVKHRNSIETWSAAPVALTKNTNINYDFTSEAFRAYGSNEKLISNTPLIYGLYSGDVNDDGAIDATDASLIDNDAMNFVTGYTVTDVTGDYFVDAADYLVADNNAYNFVVKITP